MKQLFEPVKLGSLELDNRLVVAPMTTYSSYEDGNIREDEIPYLKARAEGGFGLVMTAACYVHKSGHAFDGQWACSSDEFLPSLRKVADAIHEGGSKACLQIHHGGRSCPSRNCGGTPWSASAVPHDREGAETPREMTREDIMEIIEAFAHAAYRAKQTGYDAVEIHGANTYLLQQFVSPHSNRRTDEWGQWRFKFSTDVTEAVIDAVGPDFPVGYRFSPEEPYVPGIRWPDTAWLLEDLMKYPLAFLHVSLWERNQGSLHNHFPERTLEKIAYMVDGRVPVIGVGGVQTKAHAEEILATGADLLALGRSALLNYDWPNRVRDGQPLRTELPPREKAKEELILPAGLERMAYEVAGWFK